MSEHIDHRELNSANHCMIKEIIHPSEIITLFGQKMNYITYFFESPQAQKILDSCPHCD